MVSSNSDLLNVETPFGTWLEVAAKEGKFEIVEYFIKSGIDINKCCGISDGGPIKSAAFEGHLDIVTLLYNNGAILDVSTSRKNPLLAAIYNNHFDVVKYLVENGIDLTASYKIGNLDKCNAYEYANQYGRTEIAEYIKEKMNL